MNHHLVALKRNIGGRYTERYGRSATCLDPVEHGDAQLAFFVEFLVTTGVSNSWVNGWR